MGMTFGMNWASGMDWVFGIGTAASSRLSDWHMGGV